MKTKHIGLILCLGIILFSAYKVYCTQVEYNEAINEYDTIINENLTLVNNVSNNNNISVDEKENNITENTPNNTTEEKKEYKIDLNKLKELNKDTVGWIILADSNISYPIVQTDNNDKYLNTTFEGKNNRAGAIYLDMNSNIDDKLNTLIIYGHNMKNGTMFRELNDLVDTNYFNNHKVFNIDLGNGFKDYEIISCYETVNTDLNSWRISFNSIEDYENWLKDITSRCTHSCMQYDSSKQTVMLSTCRGRSGGNGRFVVYLQER